MSLIDTSSAKKIDPFRILTATPLAGVSLGVSSKYICVHTTNVIDRHGSLLFAAHTSERRQNFSPTVIDPEVPVGNGRSRASRRFALRSRTTFWEAVHSSKTCHGAVSTYRRNGARPRYTYHGRGRCPPCRATHIRPLLLPWDFDRRRR
jgi:hypothetical protein